MEIIKKFDIFSGWVSKCFLPFIFLLSPFQTNAQDTQKNKTTDPIDLTELIITVYLKDGYTFEADVLISDSDLLYFNIEAVFKTLKVKCTPYLDGLVGFIGNETDLYEIDFKKKKLLSEIM
jgi:hypothetical protein